MIDKDKSSLISFEKGLKDYFVKLHDVDVNQQYGDGLPYSFHLNMVYRQVQKFKYLIEDPVELLYCKIGTYGHDSIEDARLTYNDLIRICEDFYNELSLSLREKISIKEIAEIIYLCTEFKGRNRSERKPEQFYNELKQNKLAVFVKMCDIIANVKFSLLNNSSMLDKYREEYPKVKSRLFRYELKDMFDYLDKLFAV